MELKNYTNNIPETPYAPTWNFSLGYSSINMDYDALVATCLSKRKDIMKLPIQYHFGNSGNKVFDGYTGLGKYSTTSRSSLYNILTWNTKETNLLKKYIRKNVEEYNNLLKIPTPQYLWCRCWVNIIKFGQKIKPHIHNVQSTSYLSAHFTVQCGNTFTCYINPVNQINDPEIIEEKNIPGKFTIFPSYVPHYTTRHVALFPRVTIAMDIVTKNWDYDPGVLL